MFFGLKTKMFCHKSKKVQQTINNFLKRNKVHLSRVIKQRGAVKLQRFSGTYCTNVFISQSHADFKFLRVFISFSVQLPY